VKVVLDTNILISALISPGGEADHLYQAWRTGQFTLISSEEQLEEFRRVTRYPRMKPFIPFSDAGTMVNEVRLLAEMVSELPQVDASPDPGDNFVLAMAEAGQADYLVTRNRKDLLDLARFKNTVIVLPAQLIAVLRR